MKDIILPITCKTRNAIIIWLFCPIVAIISCYYLIGGLSTGNIAMIFPSIFPFAVSLGVFITFLIEKIEKLHLEGKIPYFKCKCEDSLT